MNYLVTFFTHFDAIEYVKFLKTHRIKGTLRPVPRKVSSSCGTCVVFCAEEALPDPVPFIQEGCQELFAEENQSYTRIYPS